MRQQEDQDEEDKVLKQREVNSSSSMRAPTEVDYYSTRVPSFDSTIETEEIVASHESNATSAIRRSPRQRQTRSEIFFPCFFGESGHVKTEMKNLQTDSDSHCLHT
ncbi:hypothetical protein ACS0TY_017606 [Phlomoides rotata]